MQPTGASVSDLLTFLRRIDVAAYASVKPDNTAHATSIYYYVEDDLKFYFLTRYSTRKFHDIKGNNSAALVITDPQLLQTVQVEGTVKEVDYSKEYADTAHKLTQHLTQTGKPWENLPINHIKGSEYYAFIQVTPTWIRWTDYKHWENVVKFERHFSVQQQAPTKAPQSGS